MGRNYLVAATVAGIGVILALPALADTKAGVDAWTRGDFAGAVRLWQAEAAKGDTDALFNLGQAYKFGKGADQDMAQAEALFGQAAAKGHLLAADNFGLLLFQRGERVRAMPYVQAAAGRGDPRAQYLLGLAHFNGDLAAKDWVRGYALVSLAQQQGLPQAVTALAQMDQHLPLDQRRQAVVLASELSGQADATRARQLAAADLGSQLQDDGPASAGADYARPAVTAPRPAATPVPRPVRPKTPVAASAARGPWRIQLGVFRVAANADALWASVKGRSELAGHPRLNLKVGAAIKLQAGGYASQAAAQAACSKLAAAGFSCLAVKG